MPDTHDRKRVFISHSSADKPQVTPLAEALRARGIDVWLDQWQINPGDDIVVAINDGLQRCDAGIVVFSANSLASRWVDAEVSYLVYARIQENKPLSGCRPCATGRRANWSWYCGRSAVIRGCSNSWMDCCGAGAAGCRM